MRVCAAVPPNSFGAAGDRQAVVQLVHVRGPALQV